jgi:hypothetical protein
MSLMSVLRLIDRLTPAYLLALVFPLAFASLASFTG